MATKTVIPFGPQHPVLPEPVHLDLEMSDETVVRAIPQVGYVHRGLENLVDKRDFNNFVYIAERICGICSFGHSIGYSQAVESLMDVQVPDRAEYLRVIFHELARVHNHLLWMGLAADGFGLESMFMHSWRLRERVLDIFERTTGGRVILNFCMPGGVVHDVENTELQAIVDTLTGMRDEYAQLGRALLDESSVRSRLQGVGYLSGEDVRHYGCVGPMARASNYCIDVRLTGIGAYSELADFRPVLATDGDCYARAQVRVAELPQSVDIINELVHKIPDGPVSVPIKGNPADGAEAIIRIEQPRGEATYYLKGNGTKYLERCRVRTPTSTNIPGMVKALQGAQLADVPNIILTIDPCISCTER